MSNDERRGGWSLHLSLECELISRLPRENMPDRLWCLQENRFMQPLARNPRLRFIGNDGLQKTCLLEKAC